MVVFFNALRRCWAEVIGPWIEDHCQPHPRTKKLAPLLFWRILLRCFRQGKWVTVESLAVEYVGYSDLGSSALITCYVSSRVIRASEVELLHSLLLFACVVVTFSILCPYPFNWWNGKISSVSQLSISFTVPGLKFYPFFPWKMTNRIILLLAWFPSHDTAPVRFCWITAELTSLWHSFSIFSSHWRCWVCCRESTPRSPISPQGQECACMNSVEVIKKKKKPMEQCGPSQATASFFGGSSQLCYSRVFRTQPHHESRQLA